MPPLFPPTRGGLRSSGDRCSYSLCPAFLPGGGFSRALAARSRTDLGIAFIRARSVAVSYKPPMLVTRLDSRRARTALQRLLSPSPQAICEAEVLRCLMASPLRDGIPKPSFGADFSQRCRIRPPPAPAPRHRIVSYRMISYHIISCRVITYHIISYYIISYHIVSYHIISNHIILCVISYITS